MDDQEQLSEKLQLLAYFLYSDLDMPYSGAGIQTNKHLRSTDTKYEIRLLNTISVALTTGQPGDVYAAAFDKKAHLALVLAKNGPVTPEDEHAAETFVTLLSSATTAQDLYPFLFSRCKLNIEKRIYNVQNILKAFLASIDDVFSGYQALSLKEELPGFDVLQDALYDTDVPLPPTTQVIRDLFYTILGVCERINISDEKSKKIDFAILCAAAFTASNSRFLGSICADRNRLQMEWKLLAEKLKRRLLKLSQYDHGFNVLISRWHRIQETEFSVRWVDQTSDIEEPVIELVDYVTAIQHNLHANSTITAEEIEIEVGARNPALRDKWNSVVYTCIHAEIRIILDFLQKALSSGTPVESTLQQSIGCSKRSCFACTLWIEAFNGTLKTKWMTSGSHGKPYAGWALPGGVSDWGGNDIQIVNQRVMEQISARVRDVLDWLMPNRARRTSDEHYLSDSSEDPELPPLTVKTNRALAKEFVRVRPGTIG